MEEFKVLEQVPLNLGVTARPQTPALGPQEAVQHGPERLQRTYSALVFGPCGILAKFHLCVEGNRLVPRPCKIKRRR